MILSKCFKSKIEGRPGSLLISVVISRLSVFPMIFSSNGRLGFFPPSNHNWQVDGKGGVAKLCFNKIPRVGDTYIIPYFISMNMSTAKRGGEKERKPF